MKKVLITAALATLMATPAMAIEVYNNEEKDLNVDIYGSFRGFLGYGLGYNDTVVDGNGNKATNVGMRDNNFLYNLQNNTRLGTKIKVGGFLAHFELGANERTILTQKTGDTVGIRLAYGQYTSDSGHKVFFGKLNTPTAMGGYMSEAIDTDGGLNGFGGIFTGSRRWQVGYGFKGFSIALVEPDVIQGKAGDARFKGNKVNGHSNYEKNAYGEVNNYDKDGKLCKNKNDGCEPKDLGQNADKISVSPRIALSYEYKSKELKAKVAASYTMYNFIGYKNTDKSNVWRDIHAFNIVAGVRPTFMDGNMWLSFLARYGMNEDLFGEGKTVLNEGKYAHKTIGLGGVLQSDGKINNIERFSVGMEFGYKFMKQLGFIAGIGYQGSITDNQVTFAGSSTGYDFINSVGAYIQLPYTPIKYMKIVPEIGTYNSLASKEVNGVKYSTQALSLLAGIQMQVNF